MINFFNTHSLISKSSESLRKRRNPQYKELKPKEQVFEGFIGQKAKTQITINWKNRIIRRIEFIITNQKIN